MITNGEIICQPYSGQYFERIYDISSPWNSQNWTWIKFTNEDCSEWCGEFRGSPRDVTISMKNNRVLVLTSDYLFYLNTLNSELIDYEPQPQYINVTVTPLGDFLATDSRDIYLIESSIHKIILKSPIQMDTIKFEGWLNNKLKITCDEFLNWDNHVELELDSVTLEITIRKSSHKKEELKGLKKFIKKMIK